MMIRRAGATLIEVLVAIFIMGIGLLALLTLFPIGILTMRQAIQDDRTAHAVDNAAAIAAAQDYRKDTFEAGPTTHDYYTQPAKPPIVKTLADAQKDGPSYAIYLDPIGFQSYGPPFQEWVGGDTLGVQRKSAGFILRSARNIPFQKALMWQWFTSLDDILFDFEGKPDQVTANVFRRDSIYSWAFLLRRPKNGQPGIVDMSVVVYDDRTTALNQIQSGETRYSANFVPDPADPTGRRITHITVTWGAAQPPPNLSLGGWILDSTPVLALSKTTPPQYGPSHARFYRVVGITQTSPNTADLEIQTPVLDFPLPPPWDDPLVAPAQPYQGTIVVMDGIAEVYEMGAGKHP